MKLWTWHRRLRRETGEVYMDRWQLFKTRWLSIYVNRINMPDYDDLPHNHPWPRAYSLKLWGSYTEDVYDWASALFTRLTGDAWSHEVDGLIPLRGKPSRFSRIPEIHRIVKLTDDRPCWTLFIGFDKQPDSAWGFVTTDGVVIPSKVRKAQRGVENES